MSDHSHRRWHDLRTMLTDWLAWLDETQRWAETTAEVETGTEVMAEPGEMAGEPTSRSDLHTLLAAMTALRQDVNLQTRSARRDREQASETLETLSSAVDQLSREPEEKDASTEVDAVDVDVLLELHDALSRAERQVSQVIASTVDTLGHWCTRGEIEPEVDGESMDAAPVPEELHTPAVAAKPRTFGRLRQWFGGASQCLDNAVPSAHEPAVAVPEEISAWAEISAECGRMADRLEGLVTGYRLSLQRLERILSTCGIEPIACLGQSVDPELMEVVQVVSDSTQPPGIVADEVRCGYRRYGRVYRFAQVVATRSDATPSHTRIGHTTDGQAS